jgi:hypothetical protein
LIALIDYVVPGAGFCLTGRWARGLTQAAMVLTTMALGLALHGGVIWTSWSSQEDAFFNRLIFLVQMGGGLPAWLSLAAHQWGAGRAPWSALSAIEKAPYFELGSYYWVVAGAINYFAALNCHDRLAKRLPFSPDEGPEDAVERHS